MINIPKEYKDKGFYYISPIFYNDREFIKCGNINDNKVYFFEKINNQVLEISDGEILKLLMKKFNYKPDDKIY